MLASGSDPTRDHLQQLLLQECEDAAVHGHVRMRTLCLRTRSIVAAALSLRLTVHNFTRAHARREKFCIDQIQIDPADWTSS